MNDKTPRMFAAITPDEMFEMIEDFALGLLDYERTRQPIDDEILTEGFKEIINGLRGMGLDNRVSIITMLMTACSLYQTSKGPSCRSVN